MNGIMIPTEKGAMKYLNKFKAPNLYSARFAMNESPSHIGRYRAFPVG